jgi:DedD protein
MVSIKQLQQKLSAQGYKSYTEKLTTGSGEKIRLRAGPFATRAEAEKAAAKIKDAGMAGMVVAK